MKKERNEILKIEINKLKPYDRNNKIHNEENIELIVNSIKKIWE